MIQHLQSLGGSAELGDRSSASVRAAACCSMPRLGGALIFRHTDKVAVAVIERVIPSESDFDTVAGE